MVNVSEILFTILILILVYAVYIIWIKPARAMKFYVRFLRNQGYRVYEIPYNPIKHHFIDSVQRGTRQGDAMKFYKDIGTNYDVVVSNLLNTPLVQFYNPDFIKDFFSIEKHYQYPKEQKWISFFTRLAGHGLPFSEGENWKRKRTILNKVFNFDFVKSQSYNISKICSGAIKALQSQGKKDIEKNSVTYCISELSARMFSGIIMEIFLGGTENQVIMGQPAVKFFKKLFDDLALQCFEPLNFLLGPKFLRLGITQSQRDIQNRVQQYRAWGLEFIRKKIKQINEKIQNSEESKENHDIISAMLRARKSVQNEKQETISSEEELFEEFTAFFLAGTDTTSVFYQMMIYSIATHPEIQKKVREEIDTYMKDEDFSFQNLKNLTYIDLLQKQTTRYYGPGTHLFERIAKVDNFVNGFPVKKGTAISIMHFGNHFSEKYFKNPYEFRPERWQNECNDIPAFVTGGFSSGPRTCIGKHLVHLQSKIAIVKFMKRYKKITLGNKDFKMKFKFLYQPEEFSTTLLIDQQNKL